MKALVCEMCSSHDIVKDGGFYVCQSCGTKYTIEEARKLMIEGPVDVSGSTVKMDHSEELSNLYTLARRARDEDNSENAEKYYEMIMMKEPDSWEASFYTIYYSSYNAKLGEIRTAANSITNCLDNVFKLILQNVPVDEQYDAVAEIALHCSQIAPAYFNVAKRHYHDYPDVKHASEEVLLSTSAATSIVFKCGDNIEKYFLTNKKIMEVACMEWRLGIELQKTPIAGSITNDQSMISKYDAKLKKYDRVRYMAELRESEINTVRADISSLEEKKNEYEKLRVWCILLILFGVFFILMAPFAYKESKTTSYIVGGVILLLYLISRIVIMFSIKKLKVDISEKNNELLKLLDEKDHKNE